MKLKEMTNDSYVRTTVTEKIPSWEGQGWVNLTNDCHILSGTLIPSSPIADLIVRATV